VTIVKEGGWRKYLHEVQDRLIRPIGEAKLGNKLEGAPARGDDDLYKLIESTGASFCIGKLYMHITTSNNLVMGHRITAGAHVPRCLRRPRRRICSVYSNRQRPLWRSRRLTTYRRFS
jgi:hypothetical protein